MSLPKVVIDVDGPTGTTITVDGRPIRATTVIETRFAAGDVPRVAVEMLADIQTLEAEAKVSYRVTLAEPETGKVVIAENEDYVAAIDEARALLVQRRVERA